ncbi:hypothetical protein [Natrinema versiforme]|uniref:Uncharacterized protein n=1 Tax=Natrinema versiforme JCM 10478 TaxID=1227496 RepID=L9Y454_9EURY|nr:hypothetical protein [Natrinema versiforme]ELY68864.1 hypothetical protein C489_05843 [Natrinema versiforme JCM 10478]
MPYCWDHEDCPRENCEGELQQQDQYNVMCLSCERVWTHVRSETTHSLQTANFETVAEKPVTMADGGTSPETDCDGKVEWHYAIDHAESFETRHEAAGEAAIINRNRDERRRDVTVWAYPECDCEESVVTFDHGDCCGRCGAVIA